jgi:hypothetical protein
MDKYFFTWLGAHDRGKDVLDLSILERGLRKIQDM